MGEMEPEDLEQLLKSAKFRHISEATLVSYRDSQLDEIALALADAHLRLCLICERRLTFLRKEAEVLESYVLTDEDRASIEQLIRKEKPEGRATDYISTQRERLASYINDLVTAWTILFSKPAMRGAGDGDEVWRYKSEDGLLTAWAILESDASLTVHFSSPEIAWEGARIRFRLGPFSKEVTLQREGGSGLAAKIKIPRRQRAKKMRDISIEVV
jgi:hypothetical protein